ncbi:TIGR04255 family protein [Sulfitobacter sp. W002]|uniref:TIGR04255 family protein n=1 Tax=Sulfitobacter sp. W002 TaxID=2867024 RepID=UPI0021A5CAFF|nr:TIGR04255 family protein [Sulfitobacter sp. W002]UWR30183.1 TIGR04255 family protein [Sulfitobacter sp. W002]
MRRYNNAPILEAVLEFRWSSAKTLDELREVLAGDAFKEFDEPKSREVFNASMNFDAGEMSHERKHIGFEIALRDGSQILFLEHQKFVYIQRAPYDRWEYFLERALSLLEPAVEVLSLSEFSRVGVRFVNRIDVPLAGTKGIDTDDYITISFDGPREDVGVIEEFQMRVVKPTSKKGVHYALVVATTESPLPEHVGILLDIDVFTKLSLPASGSKLHSALTEMRQEKNDIFEECLTDQARNLFGGFEE